jgi:hypothetical protein
MNYEVKIGNLKMGECNMNVNVRQDFDLHSTREQ